MTEERKSDCKSPKSASCWDRFDRKVVLYFTGYKDTRVPGMERELKRVGLGNVERQWQFPTPLDAALVRSVPHIPWMEKIAYTNLSMGHYRAVATAYHLGCKSVLVMEDDVRFLNDLEELSNIVSSLPDDYDVALLDCFFKSWKAGKVNADVLKSWRSTRGVNEHWAEFDSLYSCGCYALSRAGMERIMFCYEAAETHGNIGKLRIADHFLDRGILGKGVKMYFARKNAAVQQKMGAGTSSVDDIRNKYEAMGLDLSEYARI